MREKSRLEKILFPTLLALTTVYLSSCTVIDKAGEKFYGKPYWNLMKDEANLAFGRDKTTPQSERILREVELRSLDLNKYKD